MQKQPSVLLPADRPYPTDIKHLTSLRFFAAYAIVIVHMEQLRQLLSAELAGMSGFLEWAGRSGFPEKAYLAVDFFFILSGFILAHVYMDRIRGSRTALRDFYIRRFARIYPLHLFTLFVYIFFTALYVKIGIRDSFAGGDDIPTFVAHLFMLHAWWPDGAPGFNRLSWSISAEWVAYLVLFPLLVIPANRMRGKPAAIVIIALYLFVVMWLLSLRFMPLPLTQLTFYMGVLRIIPEFMLGMGLYLLGCKYSLKVHGKVPFTCLAGFIFVLLHFRVPDLFVVPLFGVLILMAAEQARQGLDWFLSSRPAVYLGEASYSLYMTHTIVISIIFAPLFKISAGQAVAINAWVALFGLTILVSMISYHMIERPARRWICRKFTGAGTGSG